MSKTSFRIIPLTINTPHMNIVVLIRFIGILNHSYLGTKSMFKQHYLQMFGLKKQTNVSKFSPV